jgi:uncharacterized protein (TIGR02099 family)
MIVIKKLYRWLLYALIAIVAIFILVTLAVRFILFPNIHVYKDDFATYATQRLGQKITIGEIKTGWDGISPYFVLKNIDLFDAENRSAFHLNDAEANISWLSIPLLHPHLSKIKVDKPALTIRREANGKIFLAGIDLSGPSKPEFANWLLSQREIKIKNAEVLWLDDLRNAPPLSLKGLNLRIRNPAFNSLFGQHTFEFSTIPSIGTKLPIEANGRFVGSDVSKIKDWHGNLYAKVNQADLTVWKPWLDFPISILSGTGNTQVWLDFADTKIEKIKTESSLTNFSIALNKTSNTQADTLMAKEFSGIVSWTNFKNVQTISAQNIKLTTNTGLNILNGGGYYATSTKEGKPWLKIDTHLDQLDLTTLKHLSDYLKLPAEVSASLNGLSPVGKLHGLKFGYESLAGKPIGYKINTAFNSLGLTAYEKIPGFSNLTGSIKANENGGELVLQSKKAMLDFKDILRWPIPADELNGQINWQIDDDETEVKAKEIYITSQHITGTVNASYNLKGEDYKNSVLDLSGNFGKGNAKYASFYYPLVLGESTLHWLDTSILEGRAEDVKLLVKGKLGDFPYVNIKNQLDNKLGIFRVTAKISDAVLEYGTGWPRIKGLALKMLFEGKRMELNANKGAIFGNKIIQSKAEIPKLDADSPILSITSEIESPVVDGLKFVNESPVKLVTQGFTDDLKATGQGKLTLELKIPLEDLEASKFKGAYRVTNGTIFANPDIGLPELAKINGVLNFTENNLSTQNINTEILGGPAQFSIRSGADKTIRVNAHGQVTDIGIKKIASNLLIDNMQGSTEWTSEINIKKPMVDLSLRSNLIGMAILLPPPFNKASDQEVAFSLVNKQNNSISDIVNIAYGNLVTAKLLRTEQAGELMIERGDIGINIPATIPDQAGISLHGKLENLNADDWIALLTNPANTQRNKTDANAISINKADLKILKLEIFGRTLNNLKLIAEPASTGLKMIIDSTEINGDAEWQKEGNGKIIARLKNLTIPNDDNQPIKPVVKKEIKKLANGYPALDVLVENFQLGSKKLGSLELNAFENGDNWDIQKLVINNPDSTLTAEGSWHNWTRSPNTNLKFTLAINNIGNTLKRFGQPDAVKGGEADISGQLKWAGSPHEFDANSLNGSFEFEAKKGQFLKVQPGFGRLFGLLSLQSLPRRLSLDFRDLFSDGFAFDKITATAKIDNGIMRSNDFFMTGPAAEAKIKGETNLKTETQKLRVKVTPHVSDSLSLAALAGGPIAGAAAFVAQKILKDPFNKIVSSEYIITGTWTNPQEIESEKEKTQLPNNSSPLTQ